MITTQSKKYVIFNITDPSFCPGKKIPQDFDCKDGYWFFHPSDWNAPEWGGIIIAELRKFPFAYSPGHPSQEAALKAAEEWENRKPLLDRQSEEANVAIWDASSFSI